MNKATNATDLLAATSPCKIVYSKKAWMKTCLLVMNRNLEVGWHGVVRRSENPAEFIVEDVLIFPQRVTSASTEPEDADYVNWQDSLNTETFNKVRLYGHSHVNMGVNPSSTDIKYRADLLKDVDDFYVFQIFNKKGYISSQVYDVREGILYEGDNVELVVEQWNPAVYDLCRVLFDNIDRFEKEDVRDIQDGVEWIMNAAVELKEFMKDADEIIDEYPDWCGGKILNK